MIDDLLTRFGKLAALVVGDICLDRWCEYDPGLAEPSAETGIPRVGVVHTDRTPGAGGTVANNLVALGARRVAVLGGIGRDGHGFELKIALAGRGIDASLLVEDRRVNTFTYTKLIRRGSGVEDLPRVDFVNSTPLPPDLAEQLAETLARVAGEFDVVLVSDQAETASGGVVTEPVREALQRLAREKLVWVDSRRRIELFPGMILKPNEREAREACERLGVDGYAALRSATTAQHLVVTAGSRGAWVIDERGERLVPGRAVTPIDICGAGDSFSAGAALTLAATGDIDLAARTGSLVASITVGKRGTGTASPDELRAIA
jgi:rfaE bifunctional protein kinase chain/domain